jgi:hypothetical protein
MERMMQGKSLLFCFYSLFFSWFEFTGKIRKISSLRRNGEKSQGIIFDEIKEISQN